MNLAPGAVADVCAAFVEARVDVAGGAPVNIPGDSTQPREHTDRTDVRAADIIGVIDINFDAGFARTGADIPTAGGVSPRRRQRRQQDRDKGQCAIGSEPRGFFPTAWIGETQNNSIEAGCGGTYVDSGPLDVEPLIRVRRNNAATGPGRVISLCCVAH